MTALLTIADVEADLPGVVFDTDTVPSIAQTEGYIVDIEAEVRSALQASNATWPLIGGDAAVTLRRTCLEGVKWLVLRAKYAMVPDAESSPDIARAGRAYEDRLKRIPQLAMTIREQPALDTLLPVLGFPRERPYLSESADEWTRRTQWNDAADRVGSGRRRSRLWPL